MYFGLYGINQGVAANPEIAVSLAQLAEDLGFDSLWTTGDLVLPDPRPHPRAPSPNTPILHPAVCLGALAEHTETLSLVMSASEGCAGDALLWAKLAASLDHWSDGRAQLLLPPGFGQGGGTDLEEEWLQALRSLWGSEAPRLEGQCHQIAQVQAAPRPFHGASLPLWVQGRSAASLTLAVTSAQGWLFRGDDLASVAEAMAALEEEEGRSERLSALGTLEVAVLTAAVPTLETLEAYEALEVDRVVLLLPPDDGPTLEHFLEDVADALFDEFLDAP